jgi:hypothetical protein
VLAQTARTLQPLRSEIAGTSPDAPNVAVLGRRAPSTGLVVVTGRPRTSQAIMAAFAVVSRCASASVWAATTEVARTGRAVVQSGVPTQAEVSRRTEPVGCPALPIVREAALRFTMRAASTLPNTALVERLPALALPRSHSVIRPALPQRG